MKIAIVHGSPRKGNTHHAVNIIKEKMSKNEHIDYTEIYLPKDMPEICRGCFNCILKGEDKCPHYTYTAPIVEAITNADGLLFTTPVYAMAVSGAMKVLLDHLAYIFIVHRPVPQMFNKKALILSTTVGAGTPHAIKTIRQSLLYWGVNKIYKHAFKMFAENWNDLTTKRRTRIELGLRKIATKFYKEVKSKKKHFGYPTQRFFTYFTKRMHKKGTPMQLDKKYWEEHGWLKKGDNPFKRQSVIIFYLTK